MLKLCTESFQQQYFHSTLLNIELWSLHAAFKVTVVKKKMLMAAKTIVPNVNSP